MEIEIDDIEKWFYLTFVGFAFIGVSVTNAFISYISNLLL